MTDEQHNRYIAYAFLAHGAFQLLMTLLMGVFFYFIFSFPTRPGDPGPPPGFFAAIFGFVAVIQGIFMAPSFTAAYALLKKKSWARMASIVAAAMAAMNVPIGTAACVYAFWFFMGENWKSVYPEKAEQSRAKGELSFNEEPAWHAKTADEFQFDSTRSTPPDWR